MFSHRCKFLLNIFTQSTISSGSSSWIPCFFPNLYYLYFRTDEKRSSWFLFLFILEMFFPSLLCWVPCFMDPTSSCLSFTQGCNFIYSLAELHLPCHTGFPCCRAPARGLVWGLLSYVRQPGCPVACGGLSSPRQVWHLHHLSKGGLSATGPPGKSLSYLNYSFSLPDHFLK